MRIALPTHEGIEFIYDEIIIYLKSDANYCRAILTDNDYKVILSSLKNLETRLKSSGFIRVHHEYLVNLSHVIKYQKGDGGEICLINDETIPVSRNKKGAFLRATGWK